MGDKQLSPNLFKESKLNNIKMLNEDSRSQLIQKSKKGDNYKTDRSKGKNRYERRLHSRISHSVSTYNNIDMNKLFKDNILDVGVLVNGETSDYVVRMSFAGFLDYLHNQLNQSNKQFDTRTISRALITAFNSDQVYIHCSCPDWKYTMAFWATKNDINSVKNEQNWNGKWIRNPADTKGAGCKHSLLVLSNNTWLMKVASVIKNYVTYMEKHNQKAYADIIYPAIYQQPYEDEVQLGMFDKDDVDLMMDDDTIGGIQGPGEDTVRKANKYARTKNQFKKGNQSGIQFASPSKQMDIDDIEIEEEE